MDPGIHVTDSIRKRGIRHLPQDETTGHMLKTVSEQYGLQYSLETGQKDKCLKNIIANSDEINKNSDNNF